jgi:hypothetical protein
MELLRFSIAKLKKIFTAIKAFMENYSTIVKNRY